MALFSVNCLQAGVDKTPLPLPLGVFNFDFKRIGATPAKQFDALEEMGYTGLAMNVSNPNQVALLEEYKQNLAGRNLEIYAGYVVANLKDDNSELHAHVDKALASLAPAGASLWLIITETEQNRASVLETIGTIADQAKTAGVEFVLYPHDNCEIETAEEALGYVRDLDRDDIFISLHFCHELRGGNAERLTEVAEAIKPYLRLPTINGAAADSATDTREDGWGRSIQPLDKGDFDTSRFLRALKAVGYEGPVILHTFGLQSAEPDHHHRSIATYRQMLEAL